MNNYIAACVVLPIMLALILQFGVQIQTHHAISSFSTIVDAAKEEAKQNGYFTPRTIAQMKESILESYPDASEEELVIDVTTVPKYRTNEFDERELIQYRVGLPLKDLVAAPRIWGISEQDNQTVYYVEGSIASERLSGGDE